MPPSATIIGAGPNGLSAAIVLAQAGFSVQVREAAAVAGGASRSAALTLPGFLHDMGSAVHPLALASPFFSTLPLRQHGLDWVWPSAELAHPLDDGTAVTLERNVGDTASQLGRDAQAYRRIFAPLVAHWEELCKGALQPILRVPKHPLVMARFGLRGIWSARAVAEHNFHERRAAALFAGLAAHSFLPLESPMSSAVAILLGTAGHAVGWPLPRGGAQKIADALVECLEAAGGRVVTNTRVSSLDELGEVNRILCDVTPRQLIEIGGKNIPPAFRRALTRYEYGPGVFKVDWALSEPIPWRAKECLRAGTVHLGGTLDEIAVSERAVWKAELNSRPFVLLAQPTLFDPSRAPEGKHVVWAYCHVPNGWCGSALDLIETQIERYAPGFRECVLARTVFSPAEMQAWNENLVGGDINGGAFSPSQILFRPTWRLYSTPLRHVYLCSSSTPPGGGVHGMCGYWAAQRVLKDAQSKNRN
ncbi:MAG TPA: NAD(P)/FAD-dependent oxidoreductase [Acidobacteriaceae bacterium]